MPRTFKWNMLLFFTRAGKLARRVYDATERAVIGRILHRTPDTRTQGRIKLVFDYLFFHTLLIIPELCGAFYFQRYTDVILIAFLLLGLLAGMRMLQVGEVVTAPAYLAAYSTMGVSMLSSFFNGQDISVMYGAMWILSVLFCFMVASYVHTLVLCGALCLYLSLVSFLHIRGIEPAGIYFNYVVRSEREWLNPLITGLYVLFMMRILGRHYSNILLLEQQRARHQQQQHYSLVNQQLTKHFLLVKGLSRSGQSEYVSGNHELLDARFLEIEKQCETAIDILSQGQSLPSDVAEP